MEIIDAAGRYGTVLFVPAHEPHHFHDIAADLALLVFFGPAESSRDAIDPGEMP